MIYSFICTLLGWYTRIFHPQISVQGFEHLPRDRPIILICDTSNAYKEAALLAIHLPTTTRFVKPYTNSIGLIKKFLLKVFHIEPLFHDKHQPIDQIWKDTREHITNNHPLVFFSTQTHPNFYISKAAVKLALHTDAVFDFNLQIDIVPVKVITSYKNKTILCFLPAVPVTSYEHEYKQNPARTVKHYTQTLIESLKNVPTLPTESRQYVPQQLST